MAGKNKHTNTPLVDVCVLNKMERERMVKTQFLNFGDTVDGRNPAPPDMYETL